MSDFGFALKKLRTGSKVARAGWNGKGMYIALVSPVTPEEVANGIASNPSGLYANILGSSHQFPTREFLAMKTAQNDLVPWLASQSDLLAEDWSVVAP